MKITVLKQKRIEKGYKQEEFAKIVRMPIRTYQNYENGERTPTLFNAIEIAKSLDLKTIKEVEQLFAVADDTN